MVIAFERQTAPSSTTVGQRASKKKERMWLEKTLCCGGGNQAAQRKQGWLTNAHMFEHGLPISKTANRTIANNPSLTELLSMAVIKWVTSLLSHCSKQQAGRCCYHC
jgi:hypothetical protein